MGWRVLVRAIPSTYVAATRGSLSDPNALGPIDLDRARAQHAVYVAALEDAGLRPVWVPGDGGSPDATFVEDLAVVAGDRALVCRPGHVGRRFEADGVEAVLRDLGLRVCRMGERDGVLEGGDVLRVGGVLFVGRSARTDDAGARTLAAAFPDLEVRPLPLPRGLLHLKCVVSAVSHQTVLLAEGTLNPDLFDPAEIVVAPAFEPWAANGVALPDGVLIAAGAPATEAALRARGIRVVTVPMSEIHKGDGSPTCLSVQVDGLR